MARFRFSTDISDLGLFRQFASTRKRLIVSVIVATAVCWGIGLSSAWYALEHSTSVVLNLFLITANMSFVLIAAALQAILVGDFTFQGPWREQVILGHHNERHVSVRNHGAEFLLIVTVGIILNVGLIELSSGGFFDRYHHEGFFEVRLRSEDPQERVAALETLRDPLNFDLWERQGLRDLVVRHLKDPDASVRQAALFCIGMMRIDAATPQVLSLLKHDPTEDVRAEAAVTLARIATSDDARIALESALLDSNTTVRTGAFRGLAMLKSPLSVPKIHTQFESADASTRTLAYWVARLIEDPSTRPLLRNKLDLELTMEERCAVLDALKMVATKEDVVWARLQFSSAPKNTTCAPLIWEERDERQHYVTYSDSLRVKYLKIVANADSAGQRDWFERVVGDKEEEEYARQVAAEVLKQLKGR
jgi:predicted DNA-binding ribbon-helix-helix protein